MGSPDSGSLGRSHENRLNALTAAGEAFFRESLLMQNADSYAYAFASNYMGRMAGSMLRSGTTRDCRAPRERQLPLTACAPDTGLLRAGNPPSRRKAAAMNPQCESSRERDNLSPYATPPKVSTRKHFAGNAGRCLQSARHYSIIGPNKNVRSAGAAAGGEFEHENAQIWQDGL